MTRLKLANGTIIDGTEAPARKGDILIGEGSIEAIGEVVSSPETEVLDCSGLVVAPGFVDVHSHCDLECLEHRSEKIQQGVTTEIVGNCGFSLFPTLDESLRFANYERIFGNRARPLRHAGDYFDELESSGSYTNVAALTGHSTLRAGVIGLQRQFSDESEVVQLEKRLSASLEQGSIGFSTALNEVPSSYADFAELDRFCRTVRKYGAYYTSHLRDYKFKALEAVDEALRLGRSTGVPVQLSHVQVAGRRNWDKMDRVLELVDEAVRDGVDVGMDAYPYLAGSCNLTQLLPDWALEDGELLSRLSSEPTRLRIAEETDENMANTWADILVASASVPKNLNNIGKSVEQIAAERGQKPVDTALSLLLEQEGIVRIVSFNQSEENLGKVLTHRLTSICTDGLYTGGKPHPRTFGTYPKFLGEFVRDKKWMTLETAIHKISGLPARRFRLKKRGTLEAGNWADITVFDPAVINTLSDYDEPEHAPTGIVHVLVNGQLTVRNGSVVGEAAGVPVRHVS